MDLYIYIYKKSVLLSFPKPSISSGTKYREQNSIIKKLNQKNSNDTSQIPGHLQREDYMRDQRHEDAVICNIYIKVVDLAPNYTREESLHPQPLEGSVTQVRLLFIPLPPLPLKLHRPPPPAVGSTEASWICRSATADDSETDRVLSADHKKRGAWL